MLQPSRCPRGGPGKLWTADWQHDNISYLQIIFLGGFLSHVCPLYFAGLLVVIDSRNAWKETMTGWQIETFIVSSQWHSMGKRGETQGFLEIFVWFNNILIIFLKFGCYKDTKIIVLAASGPSFSLGLTIKIYLYFPGCDVVTGDHCRVGTLVNTGGTDGIEVSREYI